MEGQQLNPMPTPVAPDMPLQVTLQAQQWNAVLGALGEAPYRVAAPLIQAIAEQLQQQASINVPAGNGLDTTFRPQQ